MSETPTSYTPPPSPPPPPGGTYTPPPPPSPPLGGGPAPDSDRTIMLVLSYLGPLALIPLLMKKDDPDIQWHAKNGTTLLGAEAVLGFVVTFLTFVPIPFLGCGVWMISCVGFLGFLALSIFAISKALKNERFRIPVITDFAEKW